MQPGYAAYKQVQTTTADPAQLIIMLHEGALRFLRQATEGIDSNDIELAHTGIVKAERIIEELQATLDPDRGEVASSLLALYQFMLRHLELANIRKDAALVAEVAGLLHELLDAWRGASAAVRRKGDAAA